jgi:peptide/nickel transport system permease protein
MQATDVGAALPSRRRQEDLLNYAWWLLRKTPRYSVGVAILLFVLLSSVLGPWFDRYDPVEARLSDALEHPSLHHWFGTDRSGMDVFTRILWAPRIDLGIAISAVLLSVCFGVPLGLVAGYGRGVVASLLSRLSDVIQAFPVFVLAMAFVAVAGANVRNVVWVLGIISIPVYLKLTRSEVLSLREREFIEAARSVGSSTTDILFRELLPNSIHSCVVQLSVNVGWNILLTAGLSFIGAGVPIPQPEWGVMIAIGAEDMITGQWWPSVFPGLAMGLTVLGFALAGEYLGHVLDPLKRH